MYYILHSIVHSGLTNRPRAVRTQVHLYTLQVPCTPVCAAHPGLLDATWTCTVGTGCTVQADLDSKMAFGAPTWPPYSQNDLQLALQLTFQSAPDLQKVW